MIPMVCAFEDKIRVCNVYICFCTLCSASLPLSVVARESHTDLECLIALFTSAALKGEMSSPNRVFVDEFSLTLCRLVCVPLPMARQLAGPIPSELVRDEVLRLVSSVFLRDRRRLGQCSSSFIECLVPTPWSVQALGREVVVRFRRAYPTKEPTEYFKACFEDAKAALPSWSNCVSG